MHSPGERRINIHLLLASMTAGLLGLAALSIAACDRSAQHANGSKIQQYTSPMCPKVVKDATGYCYLCGMKLFEK